MIAKLKSLWATEPVAVLATAGAIIVGLLEQALTSGLISSAGAVKLEGFIVAAIPIIIGFLTRTQVSPAP